MNRTTTAEHHAGLAFYTKTIGGCMKGVVFALVVALATISPAGASCTLTDDQQAALHNAVTHLPHGSWVDLHRSLEDYIVSESIAAGFSPYDEIGVLQRLFDAGFDVHDARNIEMVVEELARASNVDLHSALDAVLAAMNHHGQRLIQLDPRVRPIIERNGRLSEVLQQIHRDDNWAVARRSGRIELERMQVMAEMGCS